jgi:hypothetical protein
VHGEEKIARGMLLIRGKGDVYSELFISGLGLRVHEDLPDGITRGAYVTWFHPRFPGVVKHEES